MLCVCYIFVRGPQEVRRSIEARSVNHHHLESIQFVESRKGTSEGLISSDAMTMMCCFPAHHRFLRQTS